ncbi:high mobility group protein [Aphelenchoides avenae]|nr:high mobility group protein [Aphelenchus avenae]
MSTTHDRELVENDDEVVEILPRRAVTPHGGGFSVTIRDTSELTKADVQLIKPFLRRSTVEPTTVARFSMKIVPKTGGWEIVIKDTSTLTSMHMRCIIDIVARREWELRGRPQRQHALPERQSAVGDRAQPHASSPQAAANVNGNYRAPAKKQQKPPKDPNAPKRPLGPYFCYLREMRAQFTLPGMTVAMVSKATSIAWAALSEEQQERWYAQSAQDKERYNREMAEYRCGTFKH